MGKIKKTIPYLIVNALAFYLLPIVIKDTALSMAAMAVMWIGLPLICFVTSMVFGVKNGFNWVYSLIVSVLSIPTIFIFYNKSVLVYMLAYGGDRSSIDIAKFKGAVVYILVYGVISLVGNCIGELFYKQR